jgi:hypothetical protein
MIHSGPGLGGPAAEPRNPPGGGLVSVIVGVVVVVALAGVLAFGGGAAGGWLFLTIDRQNIAEPVQPANPLRDFESVQPIKDSIDSFVGRLEAGDLEAAYAQLPLYLRNQSALHRFEAAMNRHPKPVRHSIGDIEVMDQDGLLSADATVRLYAADGSVDIRNFYLIKIGQTWCLGSMPD